MVRLAFVVALVTLAGCKTDTGCDGPTAKEGCPNDGSIGATCKMSSDCKGMNLLACDTGLHACVQCFGDDNLACVGTTPICASDRCVACAQHSDCKASNACLPDGSCASDTQVAYVDSGGTDNPNCTKMAPCTKVMAALTTRRPYIKLHGTTDEGATININAQNVTLLADPAAALTRSANGAVLQITGASTVEIDDLLITGAKGPTNPAVSVPAGNNVTLSLKRVTISGNDGVGISHQGGSLTISRSTISDNQGGGISTGVTSITFDITNSFIYRNGDSGTSLVGGVSLTPLTGSASRFEFNTVVDNQVKDSTLLTGGVLCDQAGFTAPNNIIARNSVGGDPTKSNANTVGACMYPTSATVTAVTGLNFKASENKPYDYHIQSGSSAIGKATTPSSITIDFDNQPRPPNTSDQGADEYKP